MKIRNLNDPVLNEEGNAFSDGTTYKKVLSIAATTIAVQELTESLDDKYKLGMVAVKLYQTRKGVIDITAEDVALLKKRLPKLFSPIVVLRTTDLLEGKKPAEERIPADELEDDEEKKA